MKKLDMKTLRSRDPCYDPNKYLPEDFNGTIKDILTHDTIPHADKLWCALRTEITSERVMRLFAVWSYRQTLQWVKNPDRRSTRCADVSEAFALGAATFAELSAAWSATESAAWSARSAARSATESAQEKVQVTKLLEMLEAEDAAT